MSEASLMKKKQVYYSYLLNREKDALYSIGLHKSDNPPIILWKTITTAKRNRHTDCYDGENKPGPIVKITLEVLE